ncbi:rhomboid family intramembrane serine protease [Deminuibacter soli]|uniref:Rhomboid family intramembrane serine protease n=1 Tax=Deminuibacter soli TaxID=2291815 RepID=A0A3E1NQM1_9BACT|nr:rhomboid family intramembrane serine protease [Deminuibacter soli]RFM30223.1 rhomboid family intramembrane serine protease [Deminuibacter soli]
MGVMEQGKRNRMLLGHDHNSLTWLIIINAVVFVLLKFIAVAYAVSGSASAAADFQTEVVSWFVMPADIHKLGVRPWTILTQMFTHTDVPYLVGSLLWLWCFGYIMQDLTGNRKLIPVYIYGGLAGALFFELTMYAVPALRSHIPTAAYYNAGAPVMAIAVAVTVLSPRYRIFPMIQGGLPLWILTLIFVAIDATFAGTNLAVAIAHLAAAGIGYLFVNRLRHGQDLGKWMDDLLTWTDNLFNPEKKHQPRSSHQTHFYKATRQPFHKTSNITQQRIDEILDKINQEGYHFLTEEEKEFLKRASEQKDI